MLDGGTKTLYMDIVPETPPYYYPGYAVVAGNDDLQLLRMNEEHGILTSKKGDTGLHVGDIVELIPIHVCTTINQQNEVYLYDGETLRKEEPSRYTRPWFAWVNSLYSELLIKTFVK